LRSPGPPVDRNARDCSQPVLVLTLRMSLQGDHAADPVPSAWLFPAVAGMNLRRRTGARHDGGHGKNGNGPASPGAGKITKDCRVH
jgi:hypothetical protein